jgi:hypothetical protein
MNYSDHHLEFQLRLLLDPMVKAPVPPRKGRRSLRDKCQVLQLTFVAPAVREPVEVFA